jgi:arsenate reductase (thioredoxin)
MAEGLLRHLAGDRFEAGSAGTEKTAVNPLAIRAMAERGIDIRDHRSKVYPDLAAEPWDYLITVCDDANERCPWVPGGATRMHWSFPDPSRATGPEAERLVVFREVRDRIEARLAAWLRER